MHNDLKAIQFFNERSKEKAENPKNETNGIFIIILFYSYCMVCVQSSRNTFI